MAQQRFVIDNLEALQQVAQQLATKIKPGQVVFLQGDLGAGKTTLVQALLRTWGYEGIASSPTYTLVEPYQINGLTIFHFDLYRIKDFHELEFIGLADYFTSQSICLIEWPERALEILPVPNWRLQLDYQANQSRQLLIENQA